VSQPSTSREQFKEVTAAWWLLLALGVLSIAAGLVVLARPSHSLTTLAVVFGIFVLFDSVYELVGGALLGGLGAVVGILLIRHPLHGVLAVGLLIGIWFVAAGAIRLVAALALEHRLWNVIVAVLEIVAGIVIVSSPHVGFTTLALLVGISLLLNGAAMAALGWTMHTLRRVGPSLVSDADSGRLGTGRSEQWQ
jgi:uncharacterized membrane protein HdeD (DUF308 family)